MDRKCLAVLLTLMLPLAARAGDWPSDLNGDGKVTLEEFQVTCQAVMMEADRDGDGLISRKEWMDGMEALQERALDLGLRGWKRFGTGEGFARLDRDHNNLVTPEEVSAAMQWRFDLRDRNKDGVITRDEADRIDLFAIQP